MANFNHPYNTEGMFNRLMAEYLKYDTLYIGFDFDNTIWDYDKYKNAYDSSNTDAMHKEVVDTLKLAKQMGLKLCLWTSCPSEEEENLKVQVCKDWGIEPDYINWSPLSPGAKKPHFNLLLDDKAGLESAIQILCKLIVLNGVFNYMNKDNE
jgi:hypothetical protein